MAYGSSLRAFEFGFEVLDGGDFAKRHVLEVQRH